MARILRRPALALGALALVLAVPGVTFADDDDERFNLAADRSSVSQGVPTAVVLTIRPDGDKAKNECYALSLPAAFSLQGASVTAAPGRGGWTAVMAGGRLSLQSRSGNGEIKSGEGLSVATTVTGGAPGAYNWTVGGYDNNGCGGGADEQRSVPMGISGPPPNPQPTSPPTPAPTPPPAATPSPAAAPGAPGPGEPDPGPASAPARQPSASQDATPSPSPSASGSPAPDEQVGPAGVGDDPPPPGWASGLGSPLDFERAQPLAVPATAVRPALVVIPLAEEETDAHRAQLETQLTSGTFVAMSMLDPFEWFVPAATVGGPGLLVMIVLGAQMLGGALWLPAVRRHLREERRRRRPLRPAWL